MEYRWVEWLRQQGIAHPMLECGIGDDASVHRLPDGVAAVVTTDLMCEGVHFRWDAATPAQVGRKALAVNLSDLAAMAAEPLAAWTSLLLPRQGAARLARELTAAMLELANEFNMALAGGDTNTWDGPLVISVTAMGIVHGKPLLRRGAQPGDWIVVTGQLGGSLTGTHLDFTPRVREALWLSKQYRLSAGMDISDGLLVDLDRLARASGCGAQLELTAIPISAAAHQMATQSGRSPLEHALEDGEDFELLLALPAEEGQRLIAQPPLEVRLTRVGTMVSQPGLWGTGQEGRRMRLPVRGYLHEEIL